ncbi:MAG: SMC family ATPase, partial [Chloroflexi bacterium]|nr:SMC family ATPase [Chloroflexota bacterium]
QRVKLNTERAELREQYGRNLAEIKQLEGRVASTQSTIADLERGLKDRGSLQRREGELQRLLDEAREASQEAEGHEVRRSDAQARLDAGDYAQAEQQQHAEVVRQIEALGYNAHAHEEARQRAARYARYEQLKGEVELAAKLLLSEQQALSRAEADAEGRRADLEAARHRQAQLEEALAERPSVVQDLAAAEAQRYQRHQAWSEALDRRGRLQQLLDHCRHLAEQRVSLVAEQRQLAEDKAVYEELAYAYGKNGIQAMLIDGVLPELEQEANALLDRMTEGHMRVRFETQRMARTRDQVIETLDIKIADELGTRPYELYSGGEAFRANFAIRVALSKLLARRAGARLQTLIVDEGFGTQDTLGRERLVEAINSISQDFERILVITHIDELKDAFPVRIEVTKTVDGSQFSVSSE